MKQSARAKTEVRYVLDASAVLAYLQREPGYARVSSALSNGASISAVNLAEVYAKVVERGFSAEEVGVRLKVLGLRVIPFHEDDALGSAAIYPTARLLGLSLGDRVCLALAQRLRLPVLTADQIWTRMPAVNVELIR